MIHAPFNICLLLILFFWFLSQVLAISSVLVTMERGNNDLLEVKREKIFAPNCYIKDSLCLLSGLLGLSLRQVQIAEHELLALSENSYLLSSKHLHNTSDIL